MQNELDYETVFHSSVIDPQSEIRKRNKTKRLSQHTLMY